MGVRVSAKTDYGVRALLELAVADNGPVKGERLAQSQQIPLKFLENILTDLRHAGIVRAQRGAEGGYWLARPASKVTLGEVIRAVDGPLASVRGEAPEEVEYAGAAENLQVVWIALRASMRSRGGRDHAGRRRGGPDAGPSPAPDRSTGRLVA